MNTNFPLISVHWCSFVVESVLSALSVVKDCVLFVTQRFDGVEGGGFARGIESKENADGGTE